MKQSSAKNQLPPPRFLNDIQAAELLGVSIAWMRKQRLHKTGPRYYKFGRSVRYQERELIAYAAARLIKTEY